MFISSKQLFELSSICSHTYCLADDSRPDYMIRSGAAKVHILIENLYKFKHLGVKKVIPEFCDKNWNVKNLNKLFKKLRDSGLMKKKRVSWKAVDVAACVLMGR